MRKIQVMTDSASDISYADEHMKAFFEEVGAPYETWKQMEKTAGKYLK